jgi:purine-cytosine permease-like protein
MSLSLIQLPERSAFGPALFILLSAWATIAMLLVFLLLSLFMPSFAGIARALSDLLPTDPSVWPIYTT